MFSYTLLRPLDSTISRTEVYGIFKGDKRVAVIESGISQCCKLSTLCNFQLDGDFNDEIFVNSFIKYLKQMSGWGVWGLRQVIFINSPEVECGIKALLVHPEVTKVFSFPRYIDLDSSATLDMYTIRIA